MDTISEILFWVANSLLIPDIIALLLLFVRSLLLVGSFYNHFITKQKNDKLLNNLIQDLSAEKVENLKSILPQKDNSLYIKYLRGLLSRESSEAYSEYLISNFETEADKDLSISKIFPVLGLIGTLIAMSPALVNLSSGDVSGMAYNMQIVFATTVIGLVVSMAGLITLQFKQRWYSQESNHLFYISQILIEKSEK